MVKPAPHKITELHAFVGTDEHGTEGILGFKYNGTMMPMIGSDFVRIRDLVAIADQIAKASGQTYQIRRFIPADPHDVTKDFQ